MTETCKHSPEESPKSDPVPQPPPVKGRKTLWCIGILLGVLLVGGVLIRIIADRVDQENPGVSQEGKPDIVVLNARQKAKIAKLLEQCAAFAEDGKYLRPADFNACTCYQEVVRLDAGNSKAKAGLEEIIKTYLARGKESLKRDQPGHAKDSLKNLKQIFGTETAVAILEKAIAVYEKDQAEKQRLAAAAEAERKHLEATTAKLYVLTKPASAKIRILNIKKSAFTQGMRFKPGKYHLEVSAQSYVTKEKWVILHKGDIQCLKFTLPETPQKGDRWTETITGMEFVGVPGGCFQMGDVFNEGEDDEKPVHKVCVDGFYMACTEVTQWQYKKIMGNNPSHYKADVNWWDNEKTHNLKNSDQYPVESVTWEQTQDFIKKLSRKSGKHFRLPTEAEWEYAAREGGRKVRYGIGKNSINNDQATYYDPGKSETHIFSDDEYKGTILSVGSHMANGLGLFDMSGNVSEWCQDWYGKDYYRQSSRHNPQGPSSGSFRVVRGGGWCNYARYCRSAYRFRNTPGYRFNYLGFRLLLCP